MKVEQIYTGCLAHGAYYIVSDGEAAIIDPLREVEPYLEKLKQDNAKLKYIFETHFHADFVSGHLDLRKKTGAEIVYGPTAKSEFDITVAKDNQVFNVGKVKVKVLHTPGHTLESACFLLIDEEGKEKAIFTGDTLFLGDVGRPDLAQVANLITKEDLAGMLYDSIKNKIMPLSDDVVVYPGHGKGSACGKNMQSETLDTLGNQKKTNYALNQPDKETFIVNVLDGLTPPPGYFPMNAAMNKKGYESFDNVLKHGLHPYDADGFEKLIQDSKITILDTRAASEFENGFIPNSINIGLKGGFAPWVGTIIVDVNHPIVLITDLGAEEETITRLSRVGFDNVIGYLDGGFEAWLSAGKKFDKVDRIKAEDFAKDYDKLDNIIDIRKEGEFGAGHVKNAENKPLAYIADWAKDLDPNKHYFLYCVMGYRTMIAASILKSMGFNNFTVVDGGFNKIKTTNIPIAELAY